MKFKKGDVVAHIKQPTVTLGIVLGYREVKGVQFVILDDNGFYYEHELTLIGAVG